MRNNPERIRFRIVYAFLRTGLEHSDFHCQPCAVGHQHVHSQKKAGLNSKKATANFSRVRLLFVTVN